MTFLSWFRSDKWVKEHGRRVRIKIERLESESHEGSPNERGFYTYTVWARGYEQYGGSTGESHTFFTDVNDDVFYKLKEGKKVTIYVHPDYNSRIVFDV